MCCQIKLGFAIALAALLSQWGITANQTKIVLGRYESVILTNPANGRCVELIAKVDTGADRSSVDDDIINELQLDLEGADTVKVSSSLGSERRKLADLKLQIAGRLLFTTVSVDDRDGLRTRMVLGRRDLKQFLVDPSRSQLTSPGEIPEADEAAVMADIQEFLYESPLILRALAALAMLPLAGAVVVFLRTFVGLKTFGVFAPVLLALSFLQTGVPIGLTMFIGVIVAGLVLEPLLRRARISRVARLGSLLGVVVLVMLGFRKLLGVAGIHLSLGAAFPSVLTVAMIEQLWTTWEQESLKNALWVSLWTGVVIIITSIVLLIEPIQVLSENSPFAVGITSLLVCLAIGRYRGLRLGELIRFIPVASNQSSDTKSTPVEDA